jgi:hypothetical protein
MAALAMAVLLAGQLLASTPADGRELPAAERSLVEADVEVCVGPPGVCCRKRSPAGRCVTQPDGTQKCFEFGFNDCIGG